MNGNFTPESFNAKTNGLFDDAIREHAQLFNPKEVSVTVNVPLEITFNRDGGISRVEKVRILELPINLATRIIEAAQKEIGDSE